MSRSKWKAIYMPEYFLKKIDRANRDGDKRPIKVWDKSITLTPKMIGHSFDVYVGNAFKRLVADTEMVGNKFGELVGGTRKFSKHSGNKVKSRVKIKRSAY